MRRVLLAALLTAPIGCSLLGGEKVTPETRAQVGDAVTGSGSTLAAAGTASGNPILLVIGGLLVAAGVAIKGSSSTNKPENKA